MPTHNAALEWGHVLALHLDGESSKLTCFKHPVLYSVSPSPLSTLLSVGGNSLGFRVFADS